VDSDECHQRFFNVSREKLAGNAPPGQCVTLAGRKEVALFFFARVLKIQFLCCFFRKPLERAVGSDNVVSLASWFRCA
jgi:hypothetical protein